MNYWHEQEYTKNFDFSVWKRLLLYAKPYTKKLALIAFTMLICAAIDVAFPLFVRAAIDRFVAGGETAGLWEFSIMYFAAVVLQAATVLIFCVLSGRVEIGLCHRLRKIGFKRLQELPFSYYDKTPSGFIVARMTTDIQRLGDTVGWGLIDIMWAFGFLILTAITMFSLQWKLALIVLLVVPLIAVLAAYFQKRILESYRAVRRANSKITSAFNEGILGARTTKTLVREDENLREFAHDTHTMRKAAVRAAMLSALFHPIVVSLASFATCLVLGLGGRQVALGAMSVGTLTAFISYATQIFEPISSIARLFADFQSTQAAAERVISMIETEPEIADTKDIIETFGDSFRPKHENWPAIQGVIDFQNVTFRYSTGETVLSDFNLHISAGETVALVGETGAGKTTIVNLVCRFYEPTQGTVLIDGVDYKKRSILWLQSHLGYVLQTPHLFSGSVLENIRYGRLDATDAEVFAAARMVDAESFILSLENGYNTDVGEGGNRLSTGQKQLISFARALIADPQIFILDEATSSVDAECEQKIQSAIQSARKGRTCFIIAHRLSTIKSADRILVVQNGRVTEEGTHRELIKRRGAYYQLYAGQFQDELAKNLLDAQRTT